MVALKTCFKCGEAKAIDEFYEHRQMADGHLNKCKTCARLDVRAHRSANDSVREYDRQRALRPARKAAAQKGKVAWRKNHPDRSKAQSALRRALLNGRIKPTPCWVCGEKAEAHHPDYSAPLDVVWLCPRHHKLAHAALV